MRTKIIYCCRDCGTRINYNSALYGNGRCCSCNSRFNWTIKEFKDKVSKKISLSKQGKWKGKNNPFFNKHRTGKENPMFGIHRFGIESPNYQGGKPKCVECGKSIYYGCKLCQKCYTKTLAGKNNPNWKEGISFLPYSIKFNRKLKQKIRERDNFTCQICSILEKDCDCSLSVHHIDYNKKNCKVNNLISLCFDCHIKTNGNKELDRDYWYAYCMYLMNNKIEKENLNGSRTKSD